MKHQVRLFSMLLFSALFCNAHSFSQTVYGQVEGILRTADNQAAEGVTILLKPTLKTVLAGNDGRFVIKQLAPGNYTLVISLIGYHDMEKHVQVAAGQSTSVDMELQLNQQQLNEVVVLGNRNYFKTNRVSSSLRLQTPLLQTPQNIQVVTSRLISNQQIFDMLEGVTRNVSGATRVEHWDNYARITMRGSNVGAFRNGMNVSTSWGPLTEDMSMVERIEFVKGPAGFMLANGDPSGFYNVVTKKPSGRTKGEVGISLGSFQFYRATADLDGKLSKDGKLLYRLNMMGQLKGSHRQYDYNNRYSVVPVLKYLIDDKTNVTLEYTHQFSEVNVIGSNYLFSKRAYADLPLEATFAEANLDPTSMNDHNVQLVFNHRISNDWQVTAQAAYFRYGQEGASLWPWGFDDNNDSLVQRGMSIWDVDGRSKMGQLFVNGSAKSGGISHKILGGVDMSDKDYFHDWNQGAQLGGLFNIYKPVYGQAQPPVFDRSKDIRERGVRYYNSYSAFYLQDELGLLNDKLRLTLAGRYTTLNTGNVYSGEYKNSRFTPRIGLSATVSENTNVYFVSDQSFMENYGSDWQGNSFDPVVGNNLELGLKRDWMNGKWNSTFSVYRITRNNVLTADLDHPNPSGGYYSRQSGQQQTQGFEADIKGQLLRGLDVAINYAYTDARVTSDSKPENEGTQVAGSSRHVQNTWLNYRVDQGKLAGFGLSLGYQFQAQRSPWYVFDGSEQSLPNYFRLDGGISLQKEKISFNLVVNNLLNEYLYSGAPYSNYYYWQAEPGTNARFSIGYRF